MGIDVCDRCKDVTHDYGVICGDCLDELYLDIKELKLMVKKLKGEVGVE